jgi:hypothetical protein
VCSVALLIFFLTRLLDRHRARKERRIKTLTEFSDSIGELLPYFLNISIRREDEERTRAAVVEWIAKSIRYRVTLGSSPVRDDFERTTKVLGRWVRGSSRLYLEVFNGSKTLVQASKPFGLVANELLQLQHKVGIVIVQETVSRREAKRLKQQKPALDGSATVLPR